MGALATKSTELTGRHCARRTLRRSRVVATRDYKPRLRRSGGPGEAIALQSRRTFPIKVQDMQAEQIRQSLANTEQRADEASRAVKAASVPAELRRCVEILHHLASDGRHNPLMDHAL